MSKKILITQSGDHPTKFLNSPTTPPFATQTDANQEEGVTKAELDAALATPVDSRPYKVYTAFLFQNDTNAPTAIVLENTIGNIVWSRLTAGVYLGISNSAFTEDKTFSPNNLVRYINENGTPFMTRVQRDGDSNALLVTLDDNAEFGIDSALYYFPIEIRVYN